jgi:hypothetical protein
MIPPTATEWAAWLTEQERRIRQAYLDRPVGLISDYKREQEITRGYEDREILELLQNANDAAKDARVEGRVVIHLWAEGLVIANTGQAFSTEGVQSLQADHVSPKRHSGHEFIGNKGLGFRAILNWSQTPLIISGGLCLGYSHAKRARVLADLRAASQEIDEHAQTEQTAEGGYPIAMLPFPVYADDGDILPLLDDPHQQAAFQECKYWIEKGYTTAVGVLFDHPGAFERAALQLQELHPEILLFTDALSELRIQQGDSERLWSREKMGDEILVLADGKPIGRWHVYHKHGQVPNEENDSNRQKNPDYEIIVAVPLMDHPPRTALFSYFPTEVILPLPVTCHATLELAPSRKYPESGRSNGYVLRQMAKFLAEIAEGQGVAHPEDAWAACSVIMPSGEFPHELDKVSFGEELLEAARTRAIVPVLGGGLVAPAAARLIPGASVSWLPAQGFPEVANIRNTRDWDFFRKLGIANFGPDDFMTRLRSLATLDAAGRAALINGILTHGLPSAVHTSELLLDARGERVPPEARVFLSPSKSTAPTLPNWMELRFLDQALAEELTTRLKARDNRDLQNKLEAFGVREYSLTNLVTALAQQASKRKEAQPEESERVDIELLQTLFGLYLAHPEKQRPGFPLQTAIRLPNQVGLRSPANTLYFGDGFGPLGTIMQRLYGLWAPEKLLAPETLLVLNGQEADVRHFLEWLGVARLPRYTLVPHASSEFCAHVLARITYPAQFEDYRFVTRSEVERPRLENAQSIDGLETILRRADPLAVLAWLAMDDRAEHWQRAAVNNGNLSSRPGQVHNPRTYQGALPSYIRWTLESQEWLPLERGRLGCPRDCVFAGRFIETLFPRPEKPSESRLAEYGLSSSDLRTGWIRAGVLPGLGYLERDEIYARLLELPQRDPTGHAARALYRWLLESNDVVLGPEGEAFKRFRESGRMWGREGESEGYFAISELRHADVEGLPVEVTKRIKLVDLPKRVGADKVERLFGVQPVEHAGIRQSVRSYQLAVGSRTAADEFRTAKPFIYKLRKSQTAQPQSLQLLKDLQLEVCSELAGTIQYEGIESDYDVSPWEWIIAGNTLYVRADPAEPVTPLSALLGDAIGAAIASLFRLGDGGEFARMLLCKEKDRRHLLKRMRGEAIEADLQAIEEEFTVPESRTTFPVASAPGPEPRSPSTTQTNDADKTADKSQSSTITDDGHTTLEITPQPHIPTAPVARQPLRINSLPTRGDGGSLRHAVAVLDWEFCERKAMEFEASIDQGRFPLRVSHITGYLSPGCDIVSFATESERAAFQSGEDRDLGRVARFIEVKGRSSPSAEIELKGNQFLTAEQYGARYYLYRLYEQAPDHYLLAVLLNPLAEESALERVVVVSLDRAQNTQRFSLTGGLTKNAEQTSDTG